jgi:hypothetical protein
MTDSTSAVEEMIAQRNKWVLQARGLQKRVDKLRAKIDALDAEIHETGVPVTYDQG